MTGLAPASRRDADDVGTLPYLTLDARPTCFSSFLRPSSTALLGEPSSSRFTPLHHHSSEPPWASTRAPPLEPLAARFRLPDLAPPANLDHDRVLASFMARQASLAAPSSPPLVEREESLDAGPSSPRGLAKTTATAPRKRQELLSWDQHDLGDVAASSSAVLVRTQLISEMSSQADPASLDEAILDSITPLPASTLLDSKRAPIPAPSYPLSSVHSSLLETVQGHASDHFAWDRSSATFIWAGKHHVRLARAELKKARAAAKGKGREAVDDDDDDVRRLEQRADTTWVGSERIFGLSSPVSQSVVARFVAVGTLLRRLADASSKLMEGRRESERLKAPSPPEAFALAGATEEILDWIGRELKGWADGPPEGRSLLGAWEELEVMERLVMALGDVFHCGLRRSPPFRSVLPPLPEGPKALSKGSSSAYILSQLHAHLVAVSESQEPLVVRAVLGWLMERTSEGWRSGVASWIGMGGARSGMDGPHAELTEGEVRYEPWAGAEMEKALNERGEEDAGYIIRPARVPSFVSLSDARDLLEAGRALRLLRKAAPEGHPLLRSSWAGAPQGSTKLPSWLSSSAEQEALLAGCHAHSRQVRLRIAQWRASRSQRHRTSSGLAHPLRDSPAATASQRSSEGPTSSGAAFALGARLLGGGLSVRSMAPEDMLSLFDRAPDAAGPSASDQTAPPTSLRSVLSGILSRPNAPRDSGALDMMLRGYLSLEPFLCWSRLVNNALTSVYFRDLALATYLDVCQRFLLLGSPSFTSRITECLFDERWDKGDGVGLSAKLNDAPTWPPSSASISSILTAAILESVQEMRGQAVTPSASDGASQRPTSEGESHGQALRDLDERLSFAIVRPDWLGRNSDEARAERWKDRRAIEALDWLTLSFQPPPLIAPLLTAQAQMCYQRLFTFLLRLIRVQTAMRGLWRCSILARRRGSTGVGEDAHLRLLLALAHQARSFVNAYHAYVVHQLEGSWTGFMARLRRLREDAEARDEDGARAAAAQAELEAHEDREENGQVSDRDEADTIRGAETEDDDDNDELGGGSATSRRKGESKRGGGASYQLKDIFSIARYHEGLLEGMLESCFLRHRQRGVSRIVSDLLGMCLALADLGGSERFGVPSAGAREQGGGGGEEEERQLEALAARFRSKLSLLVRALQVVRDRGGATPSRRGVHLPPRSGLQQQRAGREMRGAAGFTSSTTAAADAELARQEAEAEDDLRALERETRKRSALAGDEALTALIDALSA